VGANYRGSPKVNSGELTVGIISNGFGIGEFATFYFGVPVSSTLTAADFTTVTNVTNVTNVKTVARSLSFEFSIEFWFIVSSNLFVIIQEITHEYKYGR
jgi:hypothetical protein